MTDENLGKNIFFIKTSDIVHILKEAYPNTVMLLGPPGVGKSESVRRFVYEKAAELGLEPFELTKENMFKLEKLLEGGINGDIVLSELKDKFVYRDLRLSEMAPEDLMGIPKPGKIVSTYKPMSWIYVFSVAKYGVLFIDEITNVVRQDIMSAVYKILLDKMAGETRFNDGIMVVSAGNYPKNIGGVMSKYGVSSVGLMQLPTAMIRRFRIYFVEPPTIDVWYNYVKDEIVEKSKLFKKVRGSYDVEFSLMFASIIKEFLDTNNNMFINIPSSSTYISYPNPASWSNLCIESSNFKYEIQSLIKLISIRDIVKSAMDKGEYDIESISNIVIERVNAIMNSSSKEYIRAISVVQSYVGTEAATQLSKYLMSSVIITDPRYVVDNIFKFIPDKLLNGNSTIKTSVASRAILNNMLRLVIFDTVSRLNEYLTQTEILKTMSTKKTKLMKELAKILYCDGYASVIKRISELIYGTSESSLEYIKNIVNNTTVPNQAAFSTIIMSMCRATPSGKVPFVASTDKSVIEMASSWVKNYNNKIPRADCAKETKKSESMQEVIK